MICELADYPEAFVSCNPIISSRTDISTSYVDSFKSSQIRFLIFSLNLFLVFLMPKVIIKKQSETVIKTISLDLSTMQSIVGGYIQEYSIKNFTLVFNEEGKKLNLPVTPIMGYKFYGSVIVCRTSDDDYIGLTDSEITYLLSVLIF